MANIEPPVEKFDVLVLGSGEAGKYLSWSLGAEGKRVALVERRYVGGSCPNIACLPSKNVVHSAKIAWYARRLKEFGLNSPPQGVDMTVVRDESFGPVLTVETFAGAKTICVDTNTHNVYLFQPERGPAPTPEPGAATPAAGAAGRGRGPQGPVVAAWFIVIARVGGFKMRAGRLIIGPTGKPLSKQGTSVTLKGVDGNPGIAEQG